MERSQYIKARLLFLSILSWLIYFWIINSKIIEVFSGEVGRANSSRGFGYLIFLYISKYFLLTFGIISIIFLIIQFFNKK